MRTYCSRPAQHPVEAPEWGSNGPAPSAPRCGATLAPARRSCPEETTQQERLYFDALGEVTSYDVGADKLQLFYGEDEYALLFKGEAPKETESGD